MSLHWLKTGFLTEVKAYGKDETSNIYQIEDLSSSTHGVIRQKGENVTSPKDGRMGAAYVECLTGKNNVGPANVMLSYGWSNSIGDIIDTLEYYCKSNNLSSKRTYFWICCLCNNQHRVVSADMNSSRAFDEFHSIFSSTVTSINNVVALMAPWNKPIYLQRVWCIFELFTANVNNCKLTIAMPPREREKLMEAVKAGDGIEDIFDTLASTNIECAKASKEMDRQRILEMVEEGPGYKYLNNYINTLLRGWVKDSLVEGVDTAESESQDVTSDIDFANLVHNVGIVMDEKGENATALLFLHKARIIRENVLGFEHKDTAMSWHCIGSMNQEIGQFFIALDYLHRSLAIREKILGDDDPSTAESYSKIGSLREEQGDYEQAIHFYDKALAVREKIHGKDNHHLDMADSYRNVGLVLEKNGQYFKARRYYIKTLTIRESVLGHDHPLTAEMYCKVGAMYGKIKDYDRASEYFAKGLTIQDKVLGRHPDAADSYNELGVLSIQRGEKEKALQHLEMALSIRKEKCGVNHPDTAASYNDLGIWHEYYGDYETSLKYLHMARSIREKRLGSDHPETVKTNKRIAIVETKNDRGLKLHKILDCCVACGYAVDVVDAVDAADVANE